MGMWWMLSATGPRSFIECCVAMRDGSASAMAMPYQCHSLADDSHVGTAEVQQSGDGRDRGRVDQISAVIKDMNVDTNGPDLTTSSKMQYSKQRTSRGPVGNRTLTPATMQSASASMARLSRNPRSTTR